MTTPNMNLTLPLVSQTPGPTWASQINADLTIIDAHDHIAIGVPITTGAINIDADLSFNTHAATDLTKAVFLDGYGGTPNSVHTASGDLYFVNGNGDSVQITTGGTVNVGGTGNIGGIVPNAAVNYVSGSLSYEFLDENGNRATLDTGGVQFAGVVTLQQSPYSVSYTLKLPATVPATNSFVTSSTSGSVVTLGYVTQSHGITRPMLVAVGEQVSSFLSVTTTDTSTFIGLSNSVTLTTTGRPVIVGMITEPAATPNYGYIELSGNAAGRVSAKVQIDVSGSASTKILPQDIDVYCNASGGVFRVPLTMISGIYVPPAAGTYTFRLEGKCYPAGGGWATTTLSVAYGKIYAYEL